MQLNLPSPSNAGKWLDRPDRHICPVLGRAHPQGEHPQNAAQVHPAHAQRDQRHRVLGARLVSYRDRVYKPSRARGHAEPDLDRTRDFQAPGQEQHTTAENSDMRVHRGEADPSVLVPRRLLSSQHPAADNHNLFANFVLGEQQ